MLDREALRKRYEKVRSEIPANVKLIAVSKKRTAEEIQALYDFGHRDLGENYPQELRDKAPLLPTDIRWHFIGNLQSNKVKYVAPIASVVHTIDSVKLMDALNERAISAKRSIEILVQVHIAKEATKHGLSPFEAEELLSGWKDTRWPALVPTGLMGMATFTEDEDLIRREFRSLRACFESIKKNATGLSDRFKELSMGMSGDARIAIEEGSTMVRIGTAIFGER